MPRGQVKSDRLFYHVSQCHSIYWPFVFNTLQFNKHVDDVCKSVSNKLNLLRKIKKYLGHHMHHRVLYYNAYILPSIDYCLTIYGNA